MSAMMVIRENVKNDKSISTMTYLANAKNIRIVIEEAERLGNLKRLDDIYNNDGVDIMVLVTILSEMTELNDGDEIQSCRYMSKYKDTEVIMTPQLRSEVNNFIHNRFHLGSFEIHGNQIVMSPAVVRKESSNEDVLKISLFSHLKGRIVCESREIRAARQYQKIKAKLNNPNWEPTADELYDIISILHYDLSNTHEYVLEKIME